MVKQLILILSLTRKDGRLTANLFDLWQQESVSTEISEFYLLFRIAGIYRQIQTIFQLSKAEYLCPPIRFFPGMFRELLAQLLLLHQICVTDVIQYSKTVRNLFSLSK